jgi:hypothetical protein
MIYLPLFRLIEKVEQKDQAHSLPDCVTQAGMRYSHRSRTFLVMNARF